MSDPRPSAFMTRLVHAGEHAAAPAGRPTVTPIYTSTTFIHPSVSALDEAFAGGTEAVYSRYGNPTVSQVESVMTVVESGVASVMFASGMAALHAAILAAGTPRGENNPKLTGILYSRDLYGATIALIEQFFSSLGVPVVATDFCDLAAVDRALAEFRPNVIFAEQLSNPLLRVIDVAELAKRARAIGARLVVDNTLASPLLEQPLTLGADFAVHSTTKFLGGHGDVTGGAVVARTTMGGDVLRRYSRLLGAVLGPFEANQVSRGMKTLGLRVERQCENALALAQVLQEHPRVTRVYYPGLPSHPQHELAKTRFRDRFGAMLSFELRDGTRERVFQFMDRLQLVLPGTSLGDIYTLITSPLVSSHRDLTPEARLERGIPEGLLRLSVGIEDWTDIQADLVAALSAVG
jgi:cystathionine gamma-synthase/methionine-gamma-lyase